MGHYKDLKHGINKHDKRLADDHVFLCRESSKIYNKMTQRGKD